MSDGALRGAHDAELARSERVFEKIKQIICSGSYNEWCDGVIPFRDRFYTGVIHGGIFCEV